MEDERGKTSKMPKMRKASWVHNRAGKRVTFPATSPERQNSCHLHGMLSEETMRQVVKTQMICIYTKNTGDVWFGVACADQRIFSTAFANSQQKALKKMLSSIPFNVPFQIFAEPSAFADSVLAAVKNVYDGNSVPQKFSLATEHLSAYAQKILKVTSLVPTGYVTSYGAIAKAGGGSPRAVGHVMASNPFAPIVPCHRVVSSDFTLGGYGGGLTAKLELLTREKRGYTSARQIPLGRKKLQVFPVELVLKTQEDIGMRA